VAVHPSRPPRPIGASRPRADVANWSGTWPGLVGMLNINGSLTKASRKYSTLWSEDFTDEFFLKGLRSWLKKGTVKHDLSHVRPYDPAVAPRRPPGSASHLPGISSRSGRLWHL